MEHSGVRFLFVGLLVAAGLLTVIHPRPPHPPGPKRTVISFSFWGSYEEWELWNGIANSFEAKNPGIRVKMNYIPDAYDDKIRLLLAADSAPDVMLIQDEPLPAYASYGKFADLTDWVHSDDFPGDWDTTFWPTVTESFTYNGRIMGLPIWGGDVLIIYNRKMFRDMGVSPPSDDWTFDEFIAKARDLTRDTNGDGEIDTFGFSLPGWVYFLPWTWGFGVDYLDASRTDWTFTGPAAVAATSFYQDLRFRYHISPSIQEMQNSVQEGAMFMTGRIGMTVGGPWNCLPLITEGIDFGVAHIPYGPARERYTRVTWDALCLFDKSKNKQAALRFMKYCIGMEVQSRIGEGLRSIPTRIAAGDVFAAAGRRWHEEKFLDALNYGRVQPISIQWDKMNNVMLPEYELLLLNKITPEECVESMAENIRKEHVFPIESPE
jgi:multiple sugar transport system substrate-binding protein